MADDLGQIDCGLDCSGQYDVDTLVHLTPSPAGDSSFTGWSGDCSGTGPCVVTMDAARNVTATFTKKRYALTASPAGHGSGSVSDDLGEIACGSDCSGDYDAGTLVHLSATAAGTSTFTGWSGACTADPCTVTMNAARSVTATFTKSRYVLSVDHGGTGSGSIADDVGEIHCGLDCSGQYDGDTVVTLTATHASNSIFDGWSGACTADPCVVTMDGAKSVFATFTLKRHTLDRRWPCGRGGARCRRAP